MKTRKRPQRLALAIGVSALALTMLVPAVSVSAAKTKLVSKSSAGVQGDGESSASDISGDGRFVAFQSRARQLAGGDADMVPDVFLRDLKKGKTRLISKSTGIGSGNGPSVAPSISANGRFISFTSSATDLIPGGPGSTQVYVYDKKRNKMQLVSRNGSGAIADSTSLSSAISADGRFVVFSSRASNLSSKVINKSTFQIYLRDRKKRKTTLISRNAQGEPGNGHSSDPAISPEGGFVAYSSFATNLSNKDEKGHEQIFLFNRAKKKTSFMSRNKNGAAGDGGSIHPAVSQAAVKVVFSSEAKNLVNDTNATADVYMRNRKTAKLRRVSLNWKGKELNDGNKTAETTAPDISTNGRIIVFESRATNALKGTPPPGARNHIYARHLGTGKLTRLSRRAAAGNLDSYVPAVSADGRFVAFDSDATNLIKGGDSNGLANDVFRRSRT